MYLKLPIKTLCLTLVLSNTTVIAAEQPSLSAHSGKNTTAILELYTSEGCSNCPQAEKYLSQLIKKHSQTKLFIPLAFHVDYWDYMGWEDPYSKPEHGTRQREIAARNKLNTLYTPQFVLYGRDFPAHKNIPEAITIINNIKPHANIKLDAQLNNNRILATKIAIEANNERAQWNSNIYIAITEDQLTSSVTRGENNGLLLQHQHVVRRLIGPMQMQGKKKIKIDKKITLNPEWRLDKLSLIVFAKDSINGSTHQSLQVALHPLQIE